MAEKSAVFQFFSNYDPDDPPDKSDVDVLLETLVPDHQVQWLTCTSDGCDGRARHADGNGPELCCQCWVGAGYAPLPFHNGPGECGDIVAERGNA